MQSQSVPADPSLGTSFIVGFAMHRLMRELFVQTLARVLGDAESCVPGRINHGPDS